MADESACVVPQFCAKRTLVLGCGNLLFGDDGFGPAVIEYLEGNYLIPEDVCVMDVGTGVRNLLFTLALDPTLPQKIVIVDAVDRGMRPGEIFELPVENLPPEKTDDFSLHQVPSSNLARDLVDAGIEVHVVVCQIDAIPQSVKPGLSRALMDAVPRMCSLIVSRFFNQD
ncbi:MAG: hydrogenase maturation protease [Bacteroidetes bacterium]|jgi:coenzyme F420 hydrogenase subunit delta|nr:hydrogenase maturation protease [Bacteroidota bacterium]